MRYYKHKNCHLIELQVHSIHMLALQHRIYTLNEHLKKNVSKETSTPNIIKIGLKKIQAPGICFYLVGLDYF